MANVLPTNMYPWRRGMQKFQANLATKLVPRQLLSSALNTVIYMITDATNIVRMHRQTNAKHLVKQRIRGGLRV